MTWTMHLPCLLWKPFAYNINKSMAPLFEVEGTPN